MDLGENVLEIETTAKPKGTKTLTKEEKKERQLRNLEKELNQIQAVKAKITRQERKKTRT